MPDDTLQPATPDDIREAIGQGLRNGRTQGALRCGKQAADIIAEHMERAGFVILKRPPLPALATGDRPGTSR